MAASALPDPDMPPMNTLLSTFTWARPPTRWPTSASASPRMRWLMPPRVITAPAKMKNGTARSGNDSVEATMRWTRNAGEIPGAHR